MSCQGEALVSAAAQRVNPWQGNDEVQLDFAAADVQVFAPHMSTLAMMRETLRAQGFRKIAGHTKLEELTDGLASKPADLVVVDIDQAPDETCNIVRDVRFRRSGLNPFVPVIATSGGLEETRVPMVVNSGTDDVWLRPTSAAAVSRRLDRLVRARKPFVGTPTYVGPDRRDSDRAANSDIPLLDAPNALRSKALGIDSEPLDQSIERTYRAIGNQQVRRMGASVRSAVDRLDGGSEERQQLCPRLQRLCRELTDLTAHVRTQGYTDLSDMLDLANSALVETMQADVPSTKQLEVLRLHGDSLIAVLNADGAVHEQLGSSLQQAVASVGRPQKSRQTETALA